MEPTVQLLAASYGARSLRDRIRFCRIPSPGLRNILRRNEVRTMMANARLTAAAGDGFEKTQEAKRQVHQTMYRFALGEITDEERRQILTLLRPCCPGVFFSPIVPEDRPAAWDDLAGGEEVASRRSGT